MDYSNPGLSKDYCGMLNRKEGGILHLINLRYGAVKSGQWIILVCLVLLSGQIMAAGNSVEQKLLYDKHQLSRNSSINLQQLSKSGEIHIVSTRADYTVFVDGSAVFNTSADAFLQAVTSYNNYIKWGMPMLKYVHILKQKKQSNYLVWNWLSVFGIKSKHCIKSWEKKLAGPGKIALLWELVECPSAVAVKNPTVTKNYGDMPAFRNLHGSLYIETLPSAGNKAKNKPEIYVRYYTATRLKTTIPPSIVYLITKLRLKSDIQKMFRIFEKNAAKSFQ